MRKILLLVLTVICLSACWGGYSPDSNFYRLPMLNEPNQTFNTKKSVAVLKVGLPEYLDRPQMIMIDENSPKIEIAEFNRWGEDLASMIQRKTVADLCKYLPLSKIADSAEEVQKANWDIKIEIVRMDMVKQGKAIVEANWYISDNKGKIVQSGDFTKNKDIKTSYEDYAAAVADMLSEMNLEIAQNLSNI